MTRLIALLALVLLAFGCSGADRMPDEAGRCLARAAVSFYGEAIECAAAGRGSTPAPVVAPDAGSGASGAADASGAAVGPDSPD